MNILITGATSGIGQQLVEDYLAEGHTVIACGRNSQKLSELEKKFAVVLENPGSSPASGSGSEKKLSTLQFDVTDKRSVQTAMATLTSPVDVAILNAGVCEYIDDAQHFDSALVERVFAANFFGVIYCCEALLPKLEEGSKLVVVESLARLLPFSRAQAYGGSKAAVHYFMQGLKTDLKGSGIKLITIAPGFVETPLTDKNDFEMPMKVSVTQASDSIRKGIAKGKNQIYFPLVFSWVMRLLHKLPAAMQLRLAQRMKQSERTSNENSGSR